MRPVSRGLSPSAEDFRHYETAFPYLISRLGPYCSYCERKIPTNLAVEHILPKSRHIALIGRWDNFLLACVNCNSTKGNQQVFLEEILLPDRDNTNAAFEYSENGLVRPKLGLHPDIEKMASALLTLTGQNNSIFVPTDPNLQLVALDRVKQRRQAWLMALDILEDLRRDRSAALLRALYKLALETGFFSIWMTVFSADSEIRRGLVSAFAGTAADCFDPECVAITPRPLNGLVACGKC
jgi:hypothetical protein